MILKFLFKILIYILGSFFHITVIYQNFEIIRAISLNFSKNKHL